MYLLVIVVVITSYIIVRMCKRNKFYKHIKALPGGNAPFTTIRNIQWVMKIYNRKLPYEPGVYVLERIMANLYIQEHGILVVWIGSMPIVTISDPPALELILSSSVSLEKSFEYTFLHRWLGLGLLTSSGVKWRKRRKQLTPSFHFRILEDFLPIFNEQSSVLVSKLKDSSHQPFVDILPFILLCTLDIVCETMMGAHIGAQEGENSEYVRAIHHLGGFFTKRTTSFWLWSDFVFGMTSTGRSYDKDLKILHAFTNKVIKDKKQLRLENSTPKTDVVSEECLMPKARKAFMDLLLDLHFEGQQLTEEDIREEVDTFMFEGHDTTAMAITYALYSIGLYPHVQKRVHEELDGIFGGDTQRQVTMDDVRDMKYLECVLKESQRLFPSVPMIGRKLNEDVRYGDIFIPRSTTIHVNIMILHRRPDIFPDPEVFDPERFAPENVLRRHPYAYLPFSAGPRNCIGQKFAMLEEKVIISNILRHLSVSALDPRDKVPLKVEFTLKPAVPIRLKFTPR